MKKRILIIVICILVICLIVGANNSTKSVEALATSEGGEFTYEEVKYVSETSNVVVKCACFLDKLCYIFFSSIINFIAKIISSFLGM